MKYAEKSQIAKDANYTLSVIPQLEKIDRDMAIELEKGLEIARTNPYELAICGGGTWNGTPESFELSLCHPDHIIHYDRLIMEVLPDELKYLIK
jgi:hypothetical protein